MELKKQFVVLAQTRYKTSEYIRHHEREFKNNKYCDYFRLNWNDLTDTDALVAKRDICWSEGRSLLYKHVKKQYRYYIFIDDDIIFKKNPNNEFEKNNSNTKSVAEIINLILEKYKPLMGCFRGIESNGVLNEWHARHMNLQSPATPIMGYDLNTNIFHYSVADLMFPVFHHGSGRSMWYAMYLVYKMYPKKQMIFKDVFTLNPRHEENPDHDLEHFNDCQQVTNLFIKNLKNDADKQEFLSWNHQYMIQINTILSNDLSISTDNVIVSLQDLSKYYNISCPAYINRVASIS